MREPRHQPLLIEIWIHREQISLRAKEMTSPDPKTKHNVTIVADVDTWLEIVHTKSVSLAPVIAVFKWDTLTEIVQNHFSAPLLPPERTSPLETPTPKEPPKTMEDRIPSPSRWEL